MGVLQDVELEIDAMQLQVSLADIGVSGAATAAAIEGARFKIAYDGPLPAPSASASAASTAAPAAAEVVLRDLRPGHDFLLKCAVLSARLPLSLCAVFN